MATSSLKYTKDLRGFYRDVTDFMSVITVIPVNFYILIFFDKINETVGKNLNSLT